MGVDDTHRIDRSLIDLISDIPLIDLFKQRIQIAVEGRVVKTALVQRSRQLVNIIDLDQVFFDIADQNQFVIDIEQRNHFIENLTDRQKMNLFT